MAITPKPRTLEELTKGVRSCGNWCFWIAGLTAVNAAMAAMNSERGFLLGSVLSLAVMQIAAKAATVWRVLALIFNVGVVGFFVAMGILARGGRRWAFALAFLAYGADTLALLVDPDALAIGFHAWALFSLGVGFMTAKAWRAARDAEAAGKPLLNVSQAFGGAASAAKIDGAAQDMEEMLRRLYAPQHDRRPANPREYNVDHGFYDRTMRWLEAQGFRSLGDYELADLKGTPHDPGCFLRGAVSADGIVTAAIYHFVPKKVWLRLLVTVLNRGGLKMLEFETEFSDGSFVMTGNAQLAASASRPAALDALHLPTKTAPQEILTKHLERVAAHLEARPGVTVRLVRTQEDAWAAADRQDAMKAAHRKDIGGMTREELLAHANTPEKRDAAELIWARMQERKQGATATPPPVPTVAP